MNLFFFNVAKLINVDLPKPSTNTLTPLVNIALGIIGAISVLVIVVAGIMFIVSSGEPQKITQARNAIFYALIGLAISIFAAVIVNFVIGNI